MTKKMYPEYIMENLRERLGLEENDTSKDDDIMSRSPKENFEEILEWNGIIGYAGIINDWISYIYGIDLNNLPQNKSSDQS